MLWEWGMVCQALPVTSDMCKKLLISAVFVSSLNTFTTHSLGCQKIGQKCFKQTPSSLGSEFKWERDRPCDLHVTNQLGGAGDG